jgi:type IV pilus assembly protein PilQ
MLALPLGRIVGMGALLALLQLGASPALAANQVRRVEATAQQGGKVLLRISLDETLAATPESFSSGSPPRISIDLPDTENALGKNLVSLNEGPVGGVNVVQAGGRTRLVINLVRSAQHELRVEDRRLMVLLTETGTVAASAASPKFAEQAPVAPAHAVRNVDFRRGANGEGRIAVQLSDARSGVDIRQQGSRVMVDFLDTSLPKQLARRLDVVDFATPVQFVEAFALGGNTRMVIEPKGEWEYSAYQADEQFIVEVKPVVGDPEQVKRAKGQYTGERLSLNFQNVEVRSVLQVIADFTGLNIISSDTVSGNLTLRLKDVPWDQALDIILQSKSLDKRTNGNVIWIAPKDELATKEKLDLESKQQIADLEPLTTEYFQLNYLRADEAQMILNGQPVGGAASSEKVSCTAQATGVGGSSTTAAASGSGSAQKIISKRGSVSFELKTNTLVVTDTSTKLKEVRNLLTLVDIPAKQVMIEARIVIADDKFGRELGVKFGVKGDSNVQGTSVGVSGSVSDANSIAGGAAAAGTGGLNVNLPGALVAGAAGTGSLGISLIGLGGANVLNLELLALETDNRGKIISSPRVVTANQKPAVILQGEQVPFVTPGTANTNATVTFKDAFLCLLVDPQVLNNDSIILTVEVQKDARGAAVQGNPTIETKRLKTQIRVNNGETAVLGGIYEQTLRNDKEQVPWFGDLPALGWLFKTTSKQDDKTELLVFLTPRVIKDGVALR